jgi:hypothetical protein
MKRVAAIFPVIWGFFVAWLRLLFPAFTHLAERGHLTTLALLIAQLRIVALAFTALSLLAILDRLYTPEHRLILGREYGGQATQRFGSKCLFDRQYFVLVVSGVRRSDAEHQVDRSLLYPQVAVTNERCLA